MRVPNIKFTIIFLQTQYAYKVNMATKTTFMNAISNKMENR